MCRKEGNDVDSPSLAPQPASGFAVAPLDHRSAAISEADIDRELMRQLVARDLRALETLYDRHHQIALGLACKIVRDRGLAEDVVQDAFLALWRQPERYDPTRGTARGWLLAIVHHRSVDKLRRGRTSGYQTDLSATLADTREPDPCDVAAGHEQAAQLHVALAQLPDEQRRVLELAYLQGRTHTEIATLMNCPLGTVKGRIRIGLARLRALAPTMGLSAA
jgi:RNA polymerase sigma-70 factor, ECF subfamily